VPAAPAPPHKRTTPSGGISSFPELKRHSVDKYGSVDGALAFGSRLFVAAYDYIWTDPRRGNEPAWTIDSEGKPTTSSDEGWFVDAMSEHGGVASLMYSDDYGKTWNNAPEEDTPYFLGPNFAGLAFVGFGPGYSGVPERFGDYVYAISNDCNWEGGDNVYLARVPRDRVPDRGVPGRPPGARAAGAVGGPRRDRARPRARVAPQLR